MTIPRLQRPLSAMEIEILHELARGKRCKEIALERGKSLKTIEAHKYNLMGKLQIHRTADLILLYGKPQAKKIGVDAA